jgi:fructuronate reductase
MTGSFRAAQASATTMVHLGIGAFARGHVLWCTAMAAGEEPGHWAVCAVGQRSRTVVDALRANDWRYDVELLADDRHSTTTVEVVRDGVVAADQPDRLARVLADPRVTVVTITATEAGYPGVVVEQVVAAAAARARSGAGPASFVVCDNISFGGDRLRGLAIDLAMHDGDDAAVTWLGEHAAFPNSVVDRVVPAVPEGREPSVVAEPWFRWVLQDAFAGPRPAWESAGARLVDDVAPWQAAKLHLVNAPHSMLAYLGTGFGYSTVHEAVGDELLRTAVEAALESEFIPAVPTADGLSATEDAQSSLSRFANSAVPHRLKQVGAGGSAKLPQRLSAVLDCCVGAGRTPIWSTGIIAGWAQAVRRGDVDDPRSADVWAAFAGPPGDRARALLAACDLTPSAAAGDVVADALNWWLKTLEHGDAARAVRAAYEEM